MVKVICIGMYSNEGKFVSQNWYETIDWINGKCDNLIIYCNIEYPKISLIFNQSCNIEILETPDKDMNIKAYKFYDFHDEFWNILKNMDYCIDSEDDVSYLYFMIDEQLLCSLEVTDYENYLLIYNIKDKKIEYTKIISDVEQNRCTCRQHIYDINDLTDGEEWIPY